MVLHRSIVSKSRGVGSVYHGCMCILLCIKLVWCSGFPDIYAQLDEGVGGQSAMGICAFSYISETYLV